MFKAAALAFDAIAIAIHKASRSIGSCTQCSASASVKHCVDRALDCYSHRWPSCIARLNIENSHDSGNDAVNQRLSVINDAGANNRGHEMTAILSRYASSAAPRLQFLGVKRSDIRERVEPYFS